MNRSERLNTLLEMLAERGKFSVEDIAAHLNVSAATIRRDLDHLAEQQLLTRTRGGAVSHAIAYDLPLRYKTARHASEKQRIARAAAELVAHGSVVGLTGGTTTTELARELATRRDDDSAGTPVITIVTNALNIANELVVRPQVKVVVTGGVARQQSYELVGPLGAKILQELSLDVAFLGVDAVDPDAGASAHNEDEASINRLLATQARKIVVVADSSKIGAGAFARICSIDELDILVTDSAAPPDAIRRFEEHGVDVVLV